MKQNGTWKKLETEANQVNLKQGPIEVSSERPITYTERCQTVKELEDKQV
jgi:hypothetical protein